MTSRDRSPDRSRSSCVAEPPISIYLSLDDGSVVEVAVPESSAPLLSGPFLAFEAERVEEPSS